MSLDGKLERWREAGLVDADTVRRIAAFEDSRRKPVALYALAALGAGTVALGIVSLVAANWDAIPPRVKLGCDLLLGAGLALATYSAVQKRWTLALEALVTVFYGFTLASLALVGQVYQLGTPTWQALLVWTGATLPLVLLARTRYVAALAVIGLVTTHGSGFEALFEHLEDLSRDGARWPIDVFASLLYVSPLTYVVLGRHPWLMRARPAHARTLEEVGFLGLALGGFGIGFVFYDSRQGAAELGWSLGVAAALSAAFVAALPKLYAAGAQLRRPLGAALAIAWITLAVGTTLERPDLSFVGALAQVAFLAALAWASLEARMLRVFNALTAAIALRVLVVYFEVFHSLLSTGLGLITGGILTLLLAWLWRSKTRRLAERLSQPPPAPGGDAGKTGGAHA
jgi:uncharacterized membrane protein